MGLQVAVAAPFKGRGTERIAESEFVVALSLDRDWFSPDQAKRLVDLAVGQGLLAREDGDLAPAFDPDGVEIPEGFSPDESLLAERSAFEQVLDAAVAAGTDKREAVAAINQRQADLGVTVEAAAVVYARARGLDVDAAAASARAELTGDGGADDRAAGMEGDDGRAASPAGAGDRAAGAAGAEDRTAGAGDAPAERDA